MASILDRLLDKLIDRFLDRLDARADELESKLPALLETITRTVLERTGLDRLDNIAKSVVKELISQIPFIKTIPINLLGGRDG
ncbi:hypothetical protein E3G52_000348 [Mycobacteroides abscessus]|uniref:hypothetical protein n=1 Tax=Mycobacteroides abscessus TaxID=36809 RepID=UPI001877DEFB|nr:hypothetical protein [Mycobacteroides abscessus]MBE5453484.1 hypothetical protein [Mycobacteroides abscessus]